MTATTLAPPITYQPGDLLDLGDRCPERCVTWDETGTCWGLTVTRHHPRRPGTVVYRVIGPVDDDEAWMAGPDVAATPQPDGARTPPGPPLPPAPAATDDEPLNPLAMVREVFGPDVYVMADVEQLAERVSRLLDNQRTRDPEVLAHEAWVRLTGAGVDNPQELVAAARGVITWCQDTDPGRLKLGGWKNLVAQVDGMEGKTGQPQARLRRWKPDPGQ